MIYSHSEILPLVEATRFKAEVIEKVLHLLNLLNTLNSHPFLKGKLALKGGSALNLFLFNLPRLSVDIDLNYIGELERNKMLAERPRIEQAFQAVFTREGHNVRRKPNEHAGGKWRLSYQSYTGTSGNLEVDLNFMFRQPLWEAISLDSHPLGEHRAEKIPVVDIHELAAGKLCALLARKQGRDIFDSHKLLNHVDLEQDLLRLAFVLYGAMNRKDWRSVSVKDVNFSADELSQQLLPMLRKVPNEGDETPDAFGKRLIQECRDRMSIVLPFTDAEMEFLTLINDRGEITPSLLTSDKDLQKRINRHPLLEWKARNVREQKK